MRPVDVEHAKNNTSRYTDFERNVKLRNGYIPICNLSDFGKCFSRICVNAYPSAARYRRGDFVKWAKEASERGDTFFFADPDNKDDSNDTYHLAEPRYVYRLKRDLSEEEFKTIFNWQD